MVTAYIEQRLIVTPGDTGATSWRVQACWCLSRRLADRSSEPLACQMWKHWC